MTGCSRQILMFNHGGNELINKCEFRVPHYQACFDSVPPNVDMAHQESISICAKLSLLFQFKSGRAKI